MNGNKIIGGGAVSANPGPSWKAIGTGDFNDDGHSDILWQNLRRQAAIWEMNGNRIIGGGTVSANPGPSWKLIGTGDFNDDGHSDILWQNTGGQVAIWEMDGTSITGGGTLSSDPGPGWHAIGTGDFNGDGHSDILFQSTSGQTAVWDMNGTSIVGGGTVNANSRAKLASRRARPTLKPRSIQVGLQLAASTQKQSAPVRGAQAPGTDHAFVVSRRRARPIPARPVSAALASPPSNSSSSTLATISWRSLGPIGSFAAAGARRSTGQGRLIDRGEGACILEWRRYAVEAG